MSEKFYKTILLSDEFKSLRLDQALAKALPDFSRAQIQEWIKNAEVTINGKAPKARDKIKGNEEVIIRAALKSQPTYEAEAIDLNIVYEDDALLVINKPAGMVVHPAAGHYHNTLLNALLHHAPELQKLPRAGIIHRLDKDTTGLLIIAKTQPVLHVLTRQLKSRKISRYYQAIICGVLVSGGTIDEPIGRHPVNRKQMAIIETGKKSVTHYRVVERYRAHTRIKIQLETGRTHQIRVHMAHIHYPILGDPTYGKRLQLPKGAGPELITTLRQFKRQALHASELQIEHPITRKQMTWTAPLPQDMMQLIETLKEDARTHDNH